MKKIIIKTASNKREAIEIISRIPLTGQYEITLREASTRSLEQNARMWAMLHDIAAQVEWYGHKLTAENWKDIFTAALKKSQVVPGIDGGFVVLGLRTSQMSIKAMSDLMALAEAFGAEKGVKFTAYQENSP